MRRLTVVGLVLMGVAVAAAIGVLVPLFPSHAQQTRMARLDRDYPVQPVSFTAVHLSDVFWAPKIETNRTANSAKSF